MEQINEINELAISIQYNYNELERIRRSITNLEQELERAILKWLKVVDYKNIDISYMFSPNFGTIIIKHPYHMMPSNIGASIYLATDLDIPISETVHLSTSFNKTDITLFANKTTMDELYQYFMKRKNANTSTVRDDSFWEKYLCEEKSQRGLDTYQ